AQVVEFFLPEVEVVLFPAWDCVPYDRVSPGLQVTSARVKALSKLSAEPETKGKRLIITTVNAILQRVPPKTIFEEASLLLQEGKELNREKPVQFLVTNGFHNAGTATETGEFALRGSIVDIIPASLDSKGYRLDFF